MHGTRNTSSPSRSRPTLLGFKTRCYDEHHIHIQIRNSRPHRTHGTLFRGRSRTLHAHFQRHSRCNPPTELPSQVRITLRLTDKRSVPRLETRLRKIHTKEPRLSLQTRSLRRFARIRCTNIRRLDTRHTHRRKCILGLSNTTVAIPRK